MKNLVDWKQESNGKTCLLITVARRVGKSIVVTEFGKAHYRSYVLFNFSSPSNRIESLTFDSTYFRRLDRDLKTFFVLHLFSEHYISRASFSVHELCG